MNSTRPRARWIRANRENPCPVCKKTDWCSISEDGAIAKCMRVPDGSFKKGTDNKGAEYFLHRLKDQADEQTPRFRGFGAEPERPNVDILHKAYSVLLSNLGLSKTHRENLQGRGLTDEEIEAAQYRSLPSLDFHGTTSA